MEETVNQITAFGMGVGDEDLQINLINKYLKLIQMNGSLLDHYGLSDKVAVGIVGVMTDIIEAQVKASKVFAL